jgi:hypothetical protein
VAFAQQPVVQLQDVSGNVVSQSGLVVTAAIASGGGTLGGTTTASTNTSGAAAFTNLTITGLIGARTLQFTAPGLTTATSNTITLTPGPATQLAVTGLPNPFTTLTTSPVTVTVRDISGNVATGYGGTIHFTSTDLLGTVPADYTFGPGDAGVHTFSPGVSLRTVGTQTVTATDAANSLSGSQTVTVSLLVLAP